MVVNYLSPKTAHLNVIRMATTPTQSLDKSLKVVLNDRKGNFKHISEN